MNPNPPGTVHNPFAFDASDAVLERLLMTGIIVAGKEARQQQVKLDQFLHTMRHGWADTGEHDYAKYAPITAMAQFYDSYGKAQLQVTVREKLVAVKLGKYDLTTRAFVQLAQDKNNGMLPFSSVPFDLRTMTREQLVTYPGVGWKTASFFMLFSRRNPGVACLDTHILQYMQEHKVVEDVPRQPKSKIDYLRLERAFLKHCEDVYPNRTVGEVDFDIWLLRNKGDKRGQK